MNDVSICTGKSDSNSMQLSIECAFHSFVSIGFLMSPPSTIHSYVLCAKRFVSTIAAITSAVADDDINIDTVTPLFHLKIGFENTAKFITKLICALFNNTPTYRIHCPRFSTSSLSLAIIPVPIELKVQHRQTVFTPKQILSVKCTPNVPFSHIHTCQRKLLVAAAAAAMCMNWKCMRERNRMYVDVDAIFEIYFFLPWFIYGAVYSVHQHFRVDMRKHITAPCTLYQASHWNVIYLPDIYIERFGVPLPSFVLSLTQWCATLTCSIRNIFTQTNVVYLLSATCKINSLYNFCFSFIL